MHFYAAPRLLKCERMPSLAREPFGAAAYFLGGLRVGDLRAIDSVYKVEGRTDRKVKKG